MRGGSRSVRPAGRCDRDRGARSGGAPSPPRGRGWVARWRAGQRRDPTEVPGCGMNMRHDHRRRRNGRAHAHPRAGGAAPGEAGGGVRHHGHPDRTRGCGSVRPTGRHGSAQVHHVNTCGCQRRQPPARPQRRGFRARPWDPHPPRPAARGARGPHGARARCTPWAGTGQALGTHGARGGRAGTVGGDGVVAAPGVDAGRAPPFVGGGVSGLSALWRAGLDPAPPTGGIILTFPVLSVFRGHDNHDTPRPRPCRPWA